MRRSTSQRFVCYRFIRRNSPRAARLRHCEPTRAIADPAALRDEAAERTFNGRMYRTAPTLCHGS